MAWNFCASCGTAIEWATAAGGRLTQQSCAGCGRELYRNPGVCVLCLAYQGEMIGVAGGELLDHEIVEEASWRFLTRYRQAAEPRFFAMVSDFDTEQVYLIFRAPVAEPPTDRCDVALGDWVRELKAQLLRELKLGRRSVHTGSVRAGRLRLVAEEHAGQTP